MGSTFFERNTFTCLWMSQRLSNFSRFDITSASVEKLRPVTEFDVSPAPFEELIRQGGVALAEDAIFSALELIAQKIGHINTDWTAYRFDNIEADVAEIVAVGQSLGFESIAIAGSHLQTAILVSDAVAIGATLGRLERVFEVLVSKIWDFFDDI